VGALAIMAQAAGTLLQVQQIHAEGKFKDLEAKENEALALRAAGDATHRGNLAAGRTRMAGGQLAARQQVAFASSGVDPTVGTPADVMADSRMMSELDALTEENNAAREAWGYKKQAEQIRRQNKFDRQTRGYRMAGTILGGAGQLAGSAASYTARGG
jgi:hypothetical protein